MEKERRFDIVNFYYEVIYLPTNLDFSGPFSHFALNTVTTALKLWIFSCTNTRNVLTYQAKVCTHIINIIENHN